MYSSGHDRGLRLSIEDMATILVRKKKYLQSFWITSISRRTPLYGISSCGRAVQGNTYFAPHSKWLYQFSSNQMLHNTIVMKSSLQKEIFDWYKVHSNYNSQFWTWS